MKRFLFSFFVLLLLAMPALSATWTVSNGTQLKAILQNSSVQPGDTVYLHGGTYLNPTNGQDQVAYTHTLQGTASQPIVVRSFPGEHAVIDGGDTKQNSVLLLSGRYTWFWGLEILSSDPGRVDPTASGDEGSYPDVNYIKRGTGLDSPGNGTGNKFINCLVHDCFVGIGSTNVGDSFECYGCVFYNNGWYNSYYPRTHHGHNIYIHNATGEVKSFYDCISWGAFENNVQAWSGGDTNVNDFLFDGFISFSPVASYVDGCNLLVGSNAINFRLTNSLFYGHNGHPNVELGYNSSGTFTGGNIAGNYIGGGELHVGGFSGTSFSNNFTWYEYLEGSLPAGLGGTTSRPTTNKVVVRKSQFEAGHANIVIFNWTGASSVSVDLSSVYKVGDTYNIVDVQNPTATILKGTYSGPISFPMNLTTVAQPIGNSPDPRVHTSSEFACFIVSGGTQSPVAIQLSSFIVAHTGTLSKLTWVTQSETNNYGFTVQRQNGTAWDSVQFVAGQGTTLNPHTYTWTDAASSPTAVYRLKQQDLNGDAAYYDPTAITSVLGSKNVVAEYRLDQNYPNPFNPSTTIEYSIANTERVRIIIVDMLGQIVFETPFEVQQVGHHSIVIDASRFSSGTYVYTLQTESMRLSKSMILIK